MKQSADLLKEGRRAKQGIVVGNAKHADAPLSEEGVAKSITSLTARVRRLAGYFVGAAYNLLRIARLIAA